jgi:hypothetical protein
MNVVYTLYMINPNIPPPNPVIINPLGPSASAATIILVNPPDKNEFQ